MTRSRTTLTAPAMTIRVFLAALVVGVFLVALSLFRGNLTAAAIGLLDVLVAMMVVAFIDVREGR